jgi:ADP-ribose diphosphatase
MTDLPKITACRRDPVSEWMTVVCKDVQFAPEATVQTYYAIEQPNYLTAVAMTREGRILLVRQYRPAIERFSLELPSGLLDQGEGPADGVARELLEETGYPAETITPIGQTATCSSRISNQMYSFFIITGARVSNFTEEPGVTVSSATPSELRALICSGEFSEQTHLGALALASARGLLCF